MFSSYPDVLTVEQVSDALSICAAQVYRLIHANKLRYFTVGKSFRIPKSALLAFIDAGGVTA